VQSRQRLGSLLNGGSYRHFSRASYPPPSARVIQCLAHSFTDLSSPTTGPKQAINFRERSAVDRLIAQEIDLGRHVSDNPYIQA
jgi:hypothetical protein